MVNLIFTVPPVGISAAVTNDSVIPLPEQYTRTELDTLGSIDVTNCVYPILVIPLNNSEP
jgi:hypothetical protein